MICHDRKCIFVHIPKTAGESVETVFLGHPLNEEGSRFEALPDKHLPIEKIKERYPDAFREYYKFSVVRNPWDRFVSTVLYRDRRLEIEPREATEQMHAGLKLKYFHTRSAYKMLYIDGELAVDYVARFENLDEDLKQVWSTLGMGDLTLPKKNVSPERKKYWEYYDYYTMEFIRRSQKRDIDRFGYRFDGPEPHSSFVERLLARLRIEVARATRFF